jgi:hypothetical protein
MKKHIVIACSIAALTSGAVTAQQSSPASKSTDATTVNVTGCLKTWDGNSTGGAAAGSQAAGSQAAGAQFVLTNVEHGASGDARSTPPSADKAASERGRAGGQIYILSAGNSGVNLSQHLNHKVTVTGTKMAGHKGTSGSGTSDMSATADRPGASSAPATAPGQDRADKATPAASMPALSVTSLTMVSSSCS